jgi:hypothetical protein
LFDIKGIGFVLAVDEGQLESAAKSVFGAGLDFKEYLRKFVHRAVSLPPILRLRENERRSFVESYLVRYLKVKPGSNGSGNLVDFMEQLLSVYEVTPRNFQEVMRVMAHARHRPTSEMGAVHYLNDSRVFLMSLLKVVSPEDYRKLASGVGAFEVLDIIMHKISSVKRIHDLGVLTQRFALFAGGIDVSLPVQKTELVKRMSAYFKGSEAAMFAEFGSYGASGGLGYAKIHETIEALLSIERQ